jgi:hypothetical protein
MLVIVANCRDATAQAIVRRWRDQDAQLLSCLDLSVTGWRHYLDDRNASTAVIGGRVIGLDRITGVLTLLPCVTADQLSHIVPEDRAYVAAEMMAFLVSWLSELTCPVLNRPTPACLMGPNWHPEQWVRAAAGIDIPVRPIRRRVALTTNLVSEDVELSPTTVTVIGGRDFGDVDSALAMHARKLAAVAGVEMLAVHFDGPRTDARLVGADLRPDLSSPEIGDAVLEYFGSFRGC